MLLQIRMENVVVKISKDNKLKSKGEKVCQCY
jgi:hypothetical protein